MPRQKPQTIFLPDLANEILLHVFHSLPAISDCLALAATSRHFRSLLASSHRLPVLFDAAESQYGPLNDAIRLVTQNASQAPHIPRATPSQSFALLKQVIEVGRVANKWVSVYPSQKWRGDDAASRRFLSETEQFRLRRACYRIWLYSVAFHHPGYPRMSRSSPPIVRVRAALLRPWSTSQFAEILDLQAVFRQILSSTICPSNGTVIRRHKTRHPNDPFPLYAITQPDKWSREHVLYQESTHFHCSPHTAANLLTPNKLINGYGTSFEGWGDEVAHYYVLEDMLKLDPSQLMYLYARITEALGSSAAFNAGWSSKGLVESFVASVAGEWFENNGETLAETIGFVVGERGGEGMELKTSVDDGLMGIIKFQ